MILTNSQDGSSDCLIVAHRGANGEAPENTMAAFRICREWGVDFVEIDVRSSLDGILYNHHDIRLGRTSNGKGLFNLRRSAYLDSLDGGSWFSSRYRGEKIPRVEEILEAGGDQSRFFFDVKLCRLNTLLDLVKKYSLEKRCFFWFKHEFMLRKFRRLAPHLQLKMNCHDPAKLDELQRRWNPDIIECDPDGMSDSLMSRCRELGMEVMLNFADRGQEHFSEALSLKPDRIVLDYPVKYIRGRK